MNLEISHFNIILVTFVVVAWDTTLSARYLNAYLLPALLKY